MSARARIIDATITAMRGAGLAGASTGAVLAASGAPRGSLYHYFPDGKQQVVREALVTYGVRVRQYIEATLAAAAQPGDKVRALFAAVARRLEAAEFRESCAAGAVSLDLRADDEAVRERVAAEFASWIDAIASHLPIADPVRRQSFAGLMLTAIEGGYVRGRAERSTRALDEAAEWLAPLAEQIAQASRRG